jgi:hypothetical protein
MEEQSKGGIILNIVGITGVLMSAAAAYVAFDIYTSKVVLGKAQFICTQIEQVGKNMDDVICTQYTAQKYAKQAVAANSLVAQR